MISNFTSAQRGSAFWGYTSPIDGKSVIERTQAYSFIRAIQTTLKSVLGSMGSIPTYTHVREDGKTYNTQNINDMLMDGNWGPITNRLLAGYLMKINNNKSFPEVLRATDDVARVEKEKVLNANAVKAGIYVAFHGAVSPATLLSMTTIFSGTILPKWKVAAPVDSPNSRGVVDTVPVTGDLADAAASLPALNEDGQPVTGVKPPGSTSQVVVLAPQPPISTPVTPATQGGDVAITTTTNNSSTENSSSQQAPVNNTWKYVAIGAGVVVVGGVGYAVLHKKGGRGRSGSHKSSHSRHHR